MPVNLFFLTSVTNIQRKHPKNQSVVNSSGNKICTQMESSWSFDRCFLPIDLLNWSKWKAFHFWGVTSSAVSVVTSVIYWAELSYHGNLWGGSSTRLNTEGLLKFGNNCGVVNKHCALKMRAASVIVWRITLQL